MVAPHSSGPNVFGMLREEPVVSVEVLHPVLPFPIASFVEIFDDFDAFRFRATIVRVHVFDKYSEGLSVNAEFRGRAATAVRAAYHDVGAAEMHLGTVHKPTDVSVAIVLAETEYPT